MYCKKCGKELEEKETEEYNPETGKRNKALKCPKSHDDDFVELLVLLVFLPLAFIGAITVGVFILKFFTN